MRHQLFITEPMPGIRNEQPICRVIDANVYVRPCWGGLMLGGYEANPLPFDMRDASPQFQIADMPLDVQVLRGLAAAVRDQFPGLEDAPLQHLPRRSADHDRRRQAHRRRGPRRGGLLHRDRLRASAGSRSLPAMGEMLAQLILTGTSDIPLDIMAIDRFSPDVSDDALTDACVYSYAHHYAEGWETAG